MMESISFASTVYLLGFAVSIFIAAIIKFILFFIRKCTKRVQNKII
ncbi:MAG: hypothetical protein K0R07_1909 [Sedimentibacter sp.]|jgi:hypothetical protein|nr:hypothetical protein [Sedimentibacter sp.]